MDFDGPNPPAVIGFWTIYDDVAMEDSMNRAARQEPDGPNSFMSSSIVLRADGFTSRGSDFTAGSWQVEPQEARRRLHITLQARGLQEEIRYAGWLVRLDMEERGMAGAMAEVLASALPKMAPGSSDEQPQAELRVVGQAERYKMGDDGEQELVKRTAFSMIKLEVDRSQLTPTIRPFSQPVDPAEIRRQQAEQRAMDVAETLELKRFLSDVRSRKQADPDNWQSAFNISTKAPSFGSTPINATVQGAEPADMELLDRMFTISSEAPAFGSTLPNAAGEGECREAAEE